MKWLQTLHDCESVLSQNDVAIQMDLIPPDTADCINNFQNVFVASMSDDLHTSVVLAAISDPLKTINDLLNTRKVLRIRFISYVFCYEFRNFVMLLFLLNIMHNF